MTRTSLSILLAIALGATCGVALAAGKSAKDKDKDKDKGPPIDPAITECHAPFRPATNLGVANPSEQQLQGLHDAIARYQSQLAVYRDCLGKKTEAARKANDVPLINALTKSYNESVDNEELAVNGFNDTLHKAQGTGAPLKANAQSKNVRGGKSAAAANDAGDASRYQRCLKQTSLNAQAAIEAALSWESEGGGAPAKHCHALALIAAGQAQEGATRLETLAKSHGGHDNALRVEMLSQAGDAWLVAGNPGHAVSDFRAASDLARTSKLSAAARADALADLGDAQILAGDAKSARGSLDASIALQATPQALATRAKLLRQAKNTKDAEADIDRALTMDPKYAQAILERGRIRLDSGNAQGAREDFLNAAMIAKSGPIAEAAQHELQGMEIH